LAEKIRARHVLLIGTRVGGWYDEKNKISITQQEYREAYKRHAAGQLKIIAFVRSEVWQVREDRKALAEHLERLNIATELRTPIATYPSKAASNSEFITDFLNEVSRSSETRTATRTGLAFPTGNWIHIFDGFGDVVTVLKTLVFAGLPAEESVIRVRLSAELEDILRVCLYKATSGAFLPEPTICNFAARYTLSADTKASPLTSVSSSDWSKILMLAVYVSRMSFHPTALETALNSTAFLEFDTATGLLQETPVLRGLYVLEKEIRTFMAANTPSVLSVIFQRRAADHSGGERPVPIPTLELATLLHLLDRWVNITNLCAATLRFLTGDPFLMPTMRPRSPFSGMDAEIEREQVTVDEVRDFVAGARESK
jgi:hypothetical protein